MNTTISKKQ